MWRGTRLYRMLTAYRYLAFNLPRAVTGSGMVLLLGVAAPQIYAVTEGRSLPAYLVAYLCLLVVGLLLAACSLLTGGSADDQPRGWWAGSAMCVIFFGVYLGSRGAGLPGMPELKGWWDYAPGTFAGAFALAYLGLHGSIILGINVAHPQRRCWHE
ncbi:oxidoreductase [Rhodococcus sp. D2-41]|uniref:Oxidoreductase n=2 Tax=Speluncibacter jeojiensis TaxID=2710754 RepID=A0A9X4LWT0_9ACTN|nr:oxidoreductase [Rhodococcus sp. D2-41]MDG3010869.1 oxidoreductase [Rhodococcus sp. D2-41]MDG3013843.1 oxidoreductase [Corynebacteriales bacterium D3-21]